jgi:hypothetical protein
MLPASATLDAINSAGDGLRLTYFWRVDRYAHRIERIEAGLTIPLLESIEGTELDRWPPSPPLQQLSVETLPDGRAVALLVGMAGSSHWSLTAEPIANEISLLFDVACRAKENGAVLGSAYRSLVRHELSGEAVLLHRPGGIGKPAGVEILPVPDSPATTRWDIDARGLLLRVDGAASSPQTVRWKYCVKIVR